MTRGDPDSWDELELVRRAKGGDHDACQRLVIAYEAKLLAYLTNLLGDRESARDIAQETFIAAFHALPRWKPPEAKESQLDEADDSKAHPLAPWLYRIATNRALNQLNRQPVYARLPEHNADKLLQRSVENEIPFEDRFIARELLREALSRLSELDATCLVLRFVSGASYAEIATQLDMTKEAARKRVTRGLTALRSAYSALDMEVRA